MTDEVHEIVKDIGLKLRDRIVEKVYAGNGVPPPNALSTVKKKHASHTLIDSTHMVSVIDVRDVQMGDEGIVEVGIFEPETAKYAAANEFGAKVPKKDGGSIIIPERSFMRSTYDESIDALMADAQVKFDNYITRKWASK